MSAREAPPVARGVPPTRPPMKRRTRKLAMSLTAAVGSWTAVNRARVTMYGVVRPIKGTSETGERNSGPIPYPRTTRMCQSGFTAPSMISLAGSRRRWDSDEWQLTECGDAQCTDQLGYSKMLGTDRDSRRPDSRCHVHRSSHDHDAE